MYPEYLRERENLQTLETPEGFATFRITGPELYVRDIYVRPDFRKKGVASKIADQLSELGLQSGCTFMAGTVSLAANGSTDSLKVLLAYGFKLHGLDKAHDLIVLTKPLFENVKEIRGH